MNPESGFIFNITTTGITPIAFSLVVFLFFGVVFFGVVFFVVVGISAPPRSEVSGVTIRRRVPVCLGLGVIATTPMDYGLAGFIVAVLVLNINQFWLTVGQLSELSVEVLDVVATVEVLLELIEGEGDFESHNV
jgi:hypothetical protein